MNQEYSTKDLLTKVKLILLAIILITVTIIGAGIISAIIWQLFTPDITEKTQSINIRFLFLYSSLSLIASLLAYRLWQRIINNNRDRLNSREDILPDASSIRAVNYIKYGAIIVLLSLIFQFINNRMFDLPQLTDWQNDLLNSSLQSSTDLVLLFVSAVILAPLWEEIIFRGLAFSGLSLLFPKGITIIIASLVWSLLHIYQYNGIVLSEIMIIGIIMGISVSRTHSLKLPVFLHIINNLIAFIAMY